MFIYLLQTEIGLHKRTDTCIALIYKDREELRARHLLTGNMLFSDNISISNLSYLLTMGTKVMQFLHLSTLIASEAGKYFSRSLNISADAHEEPLAPLSPCVQKRLLYLHSNDLYDYSCILL